MMKYAPTAATASTMTIPIQLGMPLLVVTGGAAGAGFTGGLTGFAGGVGALAAAAAGAGFATSGAGAAGLGAEAAGAWGAAAGFACGGGGTFGTRPVDSPA